MKPKPPADPDLADLLDNPLVEYQQSQFLLIKNVRLKVQPGAAFQDVMDEVSSWREQGFEVRFEEIDGTVVLGVQKNFVVDPMTLATIGPFTPPEKA